MAFDLKKLAALAVAGAMGLSLAAAPAGTAFAAPQEAYEDGTSNEYSHRMEEEETRHVSTVRSLRYEYRRDGDREKYERRIREEQKRHDRAVREIRSDYESHQRHHHHN